jgi:hypothetical protein
MLKDVFTPLREGADTHLGHCAKCGVVHLTHDEKIGIIECHVCVLARAGRFGQRRARADKGDAPGVPDYRGWPPATGWPAAGAGSRRG